MFSTVQHVNRDSRESKLFSLRGCDGTEIKRRAEGQWDRASHWCLLRSSGFQLIVSLQSEKPNDPRFDTVITGVDVNAECNREDVDSRRSAVTVELLHARFIIVMSNPDTVSPFQLFIFVLSVT